VCEVNSKSLTTIKMINKKTQKIAVHAGGGADNGGEKRNVLIVRVLLPIARY
jgi:hypothetical protein